VIQTPSPFTYKSEKAVSWKYGVNVLRVEEKGEEKDKNPDNNEVINNIAGIGGITRTDLLFAPPELRSEKNYRERSKDEVIADKARAFLKGKAPQVDEESRGSERREKRDVSDEEACEFLKFI